MWGGGWRWEVYLGVEAVPHQDLATEGSQSPSAEEFQANDGSPLISTPNHWKNCLPLFLAFVPGGQVRIRESYKRGNTFSNLMGRDRAGLSRGAGVSHLEDVPPKVCSCWGHLSSPHGSYFLHVESFHSAVTDYGQ